jgi:hypothetical protein
MRFPDHRSAAIPALPRSQSGHRTAAILAGALPPDCRVTPPGAVIQIWEAQTALPFLTSRYCPALGFADGWTLRGVNEGGDKSFKMVGPGHQAC